MAEAAADELETQSDKLRREPGAEIPNDLRRQSEPIGDLRRQAEPKVVRRRSEAASELSHDIRSSMHSESVVPLSSSQTDNSQEPEPIDVSSMALRVQDRCGKPMECSVGLLFFPHLQISLALFLQLQNASRLLTRYRNVFVHCIARFIDDTSTNPVSAVPIDVRLKGFWDVVWRDGERAAHQLPQGVHVQLLHWRPCSHDWQCCFGTFGRGLLRQTTPTCRLQQFLTAHSASCVDPQDLSDIELRFEVWCTNTTSNHVDMSSRVGFARSTHVQSNKLLFTETVSLNVLLNTHNALLMIHRNKVCSSPQRPSTLWSQHSYQPYDSPLPSEHSLSLRTEAEQPVKRSHSSVLPTLSHGSDLPSVEVGSFQSYVAHPAHMPLDVRSLDLDQIPEFSAQDHFSCPGTVLIQPGSSPFTPPQNPFLSNRQTPVQKGQLYEDGDFAPGIHESMSNETMESFSLAELSMWVFFDLLTGRSLPSGMERPHSRIEKNVCSYSFGCYLMGLRPRKEGRFFQKEYVFDKTGEEGRGVFIPTISTPQGLYLNQVCEVMNETECVFRCGFIVAFPSTCRQPSPI